MRSNVDKNYYNIVCFNFVSSICLFIQSFCLSLCIQVTVLFGKINVCNNRLTNNDIPMSSIYRYRQHFGVVVKNIDMVT